MATISDEHLLFMRRLGITEEDVMDPSLVTGGNRDKDKHVENRLGGDSVNENLPDASFLKTSKAVFLEAELPEQEEFFVNKDNVFGRRTNSGGCTNEALPEQLKTDGNLAFEEGRYREALSCYTRAIEILLESGNYPLKENGSLNAKGNRVAFSGFSAGDSRSVLLAALFSNRSACYLQAAKQIGTAEALEGAIRDADCAVELRPAWFKGYSRQGDAFFKMKKYNRAAEAYEMALQFDPGNSNLLQSVQEARRRGATEARERMELRKKQPILTNTGQGTASVLLAPATIRAPANINSNGVSTGRREGGQIKTTARQLWNELKPKVEASVQQPTGDDYRREQLRLFREQKEREKNGSVSPPSGGFRRNDESFFKGNDLGQTVSGRDRKSVV